MSPKKSTSKRVKARSKIPSHIKVPKFCNARDIERIMELKDERPKRFWVDIIGEVIESKFKK